MMLGVAALAILLTVALALVRVFRGPSVYDRILAVNMVGTKVVLLISLLAAIAGRGDYLDLALLYALINFIGMVAGLRYHESSARPGAEPY